MIISPVCLTPEPKFGTRNATFPLDARFGQMEMTGTTGECTATLESNMVTLSTYVVKLSVILHNDSAIAQPWYATRENS